MWGIRCGALGSRLGSPRSPSLRARSSLHRSVNFLFKKNLFLTNSLSSGGFMWLGDIAQQEIEFHKKLLPQRYDWQRALRMLAVGCLLGPLHHYYYRRLDRLLPGASMRVVLQKILADQFIASPLTILGFFYGMGFLEGKSLPQCNNEIGTKFKYVYMGDWLFWPPVQFVNFHYLPSEYRVFYINAVTMLFNVFLSYMKHYDQH